MNNFFSFYKDISNMHQPFIAFHWIHFVTLGILFLTIWFFLRRYRAMHLEQQRKFQIHMAIYFLLEEVIYSGWLLLNCHQDVWLELLPLQLCSFCVYVAIAAVYFQKVELRFFCGVIGTVAGLIAIVYPANISYLYPAFSYRTINFFMLHGAFILFGLIQLQDESLLRYGNIKRCSILLSIMVIIAFGANLVLHTDFMFIGIPSSIALIRGIYKMTGIVMFIPTILILLTLIQYIVVFILRHVLLRKKHIS